MQFLKADTSVKVVVGPFVDVGDGFTPETGITLTGADEAELLKHDNATTVSISAATWAALTSVDGYYHLTLTTSHSDTEGMVTVVVQDDDVCLPVKQEYMVVAENVYESLFESAAGAILLNVNVGSISGDATAADNLELMYDGTGYTDVTGPASRSQVDSIGAASGGSVNIEVTEDNTGGAIDPSSAVFVGSVQGATTFANTEAEDGTLHDIDDTTNDIDIVYGFNVGGSRSATEVSFAGFVQGVADEIKIKVYDHVGADWEIIGTIDGQAGTANVSKDLPILLKHTGTGSEIGKVYIRFETDSTTPSNLSVDKLLVSAVNIGQSVGYADGAIWVDTSGTAGTENFVNGTADNPCPWGNAVTISGSIGIKRFRIASGTTVTLAASAAGYVMVGSGWTLALASQSIVGISVVGASVSGIAAGTGTNQYFCECTMNAVTHIAGTHMITCAVANTQTAGEAGDYFYDRCHSSVAGTATWSFNFGAAIGNTNLNIRNYSGGVQLEAMGDTGTDTASIEGRGQVVEGTCTGGVVAIRGNFTTSGITNLTLSDDARIDVAQINAQCDASMVTYGLDHLLSAAVVGADVTDDSIIAQLVSASATADWDDFVNTTESLQALRDRGDAAWTSAESSLLMQSTTIASLASQTSFTLTTASADDSAYLGAVVVVKDASTAVQKCLGVISAYTGATKTVTLLVDPGVFTMAAGDTVDILADRSLKAKIPTLTLDITTAGRPGVDWASVENPSSTVGLSATTVGVTTLCTTVTTLTGHTAQTGDNFARLGAPAGASVSADVAAVKADTAAILLDTVVIGAAGAGLTDLGGMSTGMKAEVKTEAVAALNADTYAESSGVPAATATLVAKIAWLCSLARNKITQTATTLTVRNDADTADMAASTVSDDGTTATRGEFA